MPDTRPTVLVVEDDQATRELLQDVLEEEFRVLLARDGAEAASTLAARLPDLVVLDLGLPGQNGLDVLRAIKTAPATRDLPVIVVTGSPGQAQADESGPNAVIAKPFDLDELCHHVRSAAAVTERPEPGSEGAR